jgi:hypothetical protein
MMEYAVTMKNATIALSPVTKAYLVFVNPIVSGTTGRPNLNFMRAWMSQGSTATSAQLIVVIETITTAFGTYTLTNPVALKPAGPASFITGATTGAAGTSGTNASVAATGTITNIITDTFNNLNGYLWVASMREVITMPAGYNNGIGLGLLTAPSSLNNWSAGMTYSED